MSLLDPQNEWVSNEALAIYPFGFLDGTNALHRFSRSAASLQLAESVFAKTKEMKKTQVVTNQEKGAL